MHLIRIWPDIMVAVISSLGVDRSRIDFPRLHSRIMTCRNWKTNQYELAVSIGTHCTVKSRYSESYSFSWHFFCLLVMQKKKNIKKGKYKLCHTCDPLLDAHSFERRHGESWGNTRRLACLVWQRWVTAASSGDSLQSQALLLFLWGLKVTMLPSTLSH